jgi:hypothetical protein
MRNPRSTALYQAYLRDRQRVGEFTPPEAVAFDALRPTGIVLSGPSGDSNGPFGPVNSYGCYSSFLTTGTAGTFGTFATEAGATLGTDACTGTTGGVPECLGGGPCVNCCVNSIDVGTIGVPDCLVGTVGVPDCVGGGPPCDTGGVPNCELCMDPGLCDPCDSCTAACRDGGEPGDDGPDTDDTGCVAVVAPQ